MDLQVLFFLSFFYPTIFNLFNSNPFLNYRLYVTFKNENTKFIVPGYYAADGNSSETSAESGKIWKVHFRPNKTGNWKYSVSFQKGKNLSLENLDLDGEPTAFDNLSGEFFIEKSDKSGKDFRGLGRIKNGEKGYFKFTDKDSIFFKTSFGFSDLVTSLPKTT